MHSVDFDEVVQSQSAGQWDRAIHAQAAVNFALPAFVRAAA
jgi:hypothetical protein